MFIRSSTRVQLVSQNLEPIVRVVQHTVTFARIGQKEIVYAVRMPRIVL